MFLSRPRRTISAQHEDMQDQQRGKEYRIAHCERISRHKDTRGKTYYAASISHNAITRKGLLCTPDQLVSFVLQLDKPGIERIGRVQMAISDGLRECAISFVC